MIRKQIYFFFAAILLLQSCDIINEADRLIEVPQVAANKTVMIIEFTDQKCVNCPRATDVIEQLKEEYPDKIISVSIHAYITNLPLVTQIGKDYNTLFQPSVYVHPVALIDGAKQISEATEAWPSMVRKAVQAEALADLSISCTYDSISKNLKAISSIRGVDADLSHVNLQLWLTEDNITSYQLQSDGSRDNAYVHHNVLRTTINGFRGKTYSISPGLIVSDTTEYTISSTSWNKNNLYVTGFIYSGENFDNIIKAVKTKISYE